MGDRQCFFTNVAQLEPAPLGRSQGWVDLNIRFLTQALTGFGEVCLFRAGFPPGAEHQRHVHANAVEFFYVITGTGASGCGEEEHPVGPGSFELVEKGAVHWLRNLSPDQPVEVVGGYLAVGNFEATGYALVGAIGKRHRHVTDGLDLSGGAGLS